MKYKRLTPLDKEKLKRNSESSVKSVKSVLQEAEKVFQKIQKLDSNNVYICYMLNNDELHSMLGLC